MKISFFSLCVISFALSIEARSQQLVLSRKSRVIERFNVGDEIQYATLRHGKRKGILSSITAFNLVIDNDTVKVADVRRIGAVNSRKDALWAARGYKVALAGVLLGLGDLITVTVVQDKEYEPDKAVLIVSAGLISAGTIMIMSDALTRINRSNRLKVVDIESELYRKR